MTKEQELALTEEISQFTEEKIEAEIWEILEVEIKKRNTGSAEIQRLQSRLIILLRLFPEGSNKNRVLQKVKDKQRFCYYINDTGILDFTGYGGSYG